MTNEAIHGGGDAAKIHEPLLARLNDSGTEVINVRQRLDSLLHALKNEAPSPEEDKPIMSCVTEALSEVPVLIRTECNSIHKHITELEELLLN